MLFSVLKKEAKHLLNDRGFLLLAILQPIIFIIMFGSSFQGGDINHLNTIIIDEDHSNFSQYVLDSAQESEFFDVINFSGSLEEALFKLNKSEVRAVIFIPSKFEENIQNTVTVHISIYLDSSNFLTYSSLSGAKVGIAKDSLQKITGDILEELENEKKQSKDKIEEIKGMIREVEDESVYLDRDLESLRGDLDELKGSSLDELDDLVNDMKNSLDKQKNSLELSEDGLDDLIFVLTDLKTLNATEEQKKLLIISQISSIRNGFNKSNEEISEIISNINEVSVPRFDDLSKSDLIEDRFNKIRNMFEEIQNKTKDINFEFSKLERKFLSEPLILDDIAIHGPIRYFDYLSAGVLSLIVFFICLMAPSFNIISEKEKNTLYRLSTTPASSITIFVGKFIVFFIFGFIEMLYTLFLSIAIYDVRISGSIYDIILVLSLLACSSISLGLFISSKVKTMQQAFMIIPIVVIPSFLISHAFFPPEVMAGFMNYVAYITPMTFSNHALNAIMIKGFSLSKIMTDIYVLIGFTLIPLILFIWSYRKIKY